MRSCESILNQDALLGCCGGLTSDGNLVFDGEHPGYRPREPLGFFTLGPRLRDTAQTDVRFVHINGQSPGVEQRTSLKPVLESRLDVDRDRLAFYRDQIREPTDALQIAHGTLGRQPLVPPSRGTVQRNPAVLDHGFDTWRNGLARRAAATSDVPVGALIVLNDRVIGEGAESVKARRDVTGHAEIEAIRAACERLRSLDLTGCTLYTSVEPCAMCAYAVRLARVSVVVTGARSSDAEWPLNGWLVLTSGDILPDRPPPLVVRDVLSRECHALLTEPRGEQRA